MVNTQQHALAVDAARETQSWHEDVREHVLARIARPPWRPPRWLRRGAIVVALLLHVAILGALRNAMYPPTASPQTAIEVILRNTVAPPPWPRPPSAPPTRHITATLVPASPPAATASRSASAPNVSAAPRPLLFNRDGSVRLPPAATFTTPLDAGIERARELLARGHNIIHCRRSRFDDAPAPEQAGISAGRGARMAHLVMGNPLDPLLNVGLEHVIESVRELAEARRAIEDQACDD